MSTETLLTAWALPSYERAERRVAAGHEPANFLKVHAELHRLVGGVGGCYLRAAIRGLERRGLGLGCGTLPVPPLVSIVRRGLWSFISQADEDGVMRRLKTAEEKNYVSNS